MPVVLIGRPLDGSTAPRAEAADAAKGDRRPQGAARPGRARAFKISAATLVAAAIRNARNAKLKPEAGAILMINTASDPLAEDRVPGASATPCTRRGSPTIEELRFDRDARSRRRS